MKRADRKIQIIEATLELLRDLRVDQVSTRRIARKIGVSQPSLFRHFRSREAILEAIVEHMRQRLEGVVTEILRSESAPLEKTGLLLAQLLLLVEEQPGLPRLLFHDVSTAGSPSLRRRLAHLVSMQNELVATLVSEARDRGELSARVDPALAARMWVACLQGNVLLWQLEGRARALSDMAAPILQTWLGGLERGCAREVEAASPPVPAPLISLQRLDLRPLLERGEDPLGHVLDHVRRLAPEGLLLLHVPFHPRPLIALLEGRGFKLGVRPLEGSEVEVWIYGRAAPHVYDLSGLPAPEPLERVLSLAAELEPGSSLLAHTPLVPRMLMTPARALGCEVKMLSCGDQSGLVHLSRAP